MTTAHIKTLLRPCIITLALGLASAVANAAALTNFSVSPTPYTDGGFADTTQSPTLYLGHTDNAACTSDMCDSCSASSSSTAITTTSTCSVKELQSGTTLTFTFTNPTAATVGNTVYAKIMGSTTIINYSSFVVTTANQTMTVTVTGNNLITGLGCTMTTSCSGTITVGWGTDESTTFTDQTIVNVKYRYVLSAADQAATFGCTSGTTPGAYEGLCHFNVFPGDSKAYITPLNMVTSSNYAVPNMNTAGNTGTADTSGMIYAALRFYYIHTTSTTPSTAFSIPSAGQSGENDYQDIPVTNGALQSKYVSGLHNFTQGAADEYQFMAASIDQAGILTYFVQPTTAAGINYAITPTGTTQACQPQEVYGLINGQGCMIATAAYGSVLEPQVTFLREFRGRYLMNNSLGRQFVHWYYQNSSPWAIRISQSEGLRAATRAGLFPVVGFARLALWIGFWPACGVLMLALAGIIILVRRLRMRSTSGANS